jgi:hypothetical protein
VVAMLPSMRIGIEGAFYFCALRYRLGCGENSEGPGGIVEIAAYSEFLGTLKRGSVWNRPIAAGEAYVFQCALGIPSN